MKEPIDKFPLRYAILRHEGVAEPHFDLLFESEPGSPLLAWRSPVWPPTGNTTLVPLPAHRRIYLEYEGPVSGNRGQVHRVASGHHRRLTRNGRAILQTDTGIEIKLAD